MRLTLKHPITEGDDEVQVKFWSFFKCYLYSIAVAQIITFIVIFVAVFLYTLVMGV